MNTQTIIDVVEGLEITFLLFFLFDILVILGIALTVFFVPRNTKGIVRYMIGNAGGQIEIVDDSIDTINQRMPLSVQDVEWYLQEVRKKKPNALNGIQRIELCNRPITYSSNIMGSYTPSHPDGKIIRLYSVSYYPLRELFTLDFSSIGDIKFGYDEVQTRRMLLSTLGHEIGHNVFYDRTGRLYGEDVEAFCDDFSEKLNIVEDPQFEGKRFHVDDPVNVYL